MATVVGQPCGKPREHKATGPSVSGCHRASSRPYCLPGVPGVGAGRWRSSGRTWRTTGERSRRRRSHRIGPSSLRPHGNSAGTGDTATHSGLRHTVTVTRAAADRVRSAPGLFPLEDLRAQLAEMALASPAVPARKEQRAALAPLLDAFFRGLGSRAVEVLSAHLDRAGARLVWLVEVEQRRVMSAALR
jgi:hypothetical protein